jgi:hypothetical protein
LSALADILVDLVATLVSGFLVGTGAFEVTTTTLLWLKIKFCYLILLPCIAALTETPGLLEDDKPFQSLQ